MPIDHHLGAKDHTKILHIYIVTSNQSIFIIRTADRCIPGSCRATMQRPSSPLKESWQPWRRWPVPCRCWRKVWLMAHCAWNRLMLWRYTLQQAPLATIQSRCCWKGWGSPSNSRNFDYNVFKAQLPHCLIKLIIKLLGIFLLSCDSSLIQFSVCHFTPELYGSILSQHTDGQTIHHTYSCKCPLQSLDDNKKKLFQLYIAWLVVNIEDIVEANIAPDQTNICMHLRCFRVSTRMRQTHTWRRASRSNRWQPFS